MKGDRVPDRDHCARYCGGATIDEDGRVTGNAFRLRNRGDTPESYLSVNWLEFLTRSDRSEQVKALQQVFATKTRFKVGSTARFAVHQTGELRDHVLATSPDARRLDVLHEPEPDDESHAGLYGLGLDDELIAELIAEAVQETYPARP
jgi:hypothetical protein